jgi:hypothetical protein
LSEVDHAPDTGLSLLKVMILLESNPSDKMSGSHLISACRSELKVVRPAGFVSPSKLVVELAVVPVQAEGKTEAKAVLRLVLLPVVVRAGS